MKCAACNHLAVMHRRELRGEGCLTNPNCGCSLTQAQAARNPSAECLHPNTWRDSWQCECGELHTRCSSCAAFVDGCSLETKLPTGVALAAEYAKMVERREKQRELVINRLATDPEVDAIRTAAENLRAGRVTYAQEFLLSKAGLGGRRKNMTDEEARQTAIDVTKDELTLLQAEYEIALRGLNL